MELRKFRAEDMDECTHLFLKVFSDDPWNDKWESFDQAKEYLLELVENPVFEGFVISEGGIIGVCFGHKRSWWMGKEYCIDEMFVAKENQGQGVGTKLLRFAEENLKKEGIKKFMLLTGKDLPAERFYHKNGFYRSASIIVMAKK